VNVQSSFHPPPSFGPNPAIIAHMSVLVRAVLLCLVGAALGLVANGFTPRPAQLGTPVYPAADAPGALCADPHATVPRISVEEAKPLCVSCTATFVDARSAGEYTTGHVTGALHLAPGEPIEPLLPALHSAAMVVVYDRDRDCSAANEVAAQIKAQGIRDVRVLTGAWPEWLARGGPGESGACGLCSAAAR
jgi:rhodanese-related sulfurtransferase